MPDAATSRLVPRSGWIRISPTGASNSTPAKMKSRKRVCPSRNWKNHASIKGIAIFISSEGWMRATPRSSQRCAPLDTSPKSSTATSSSTPSRYSGTANDSRRCGLSQASTHMPASAIPMWVICVSSRSGEALCISTWA